MSEYDDALLLAIRAHAGQTRWSGDPYVVHPIRVARDAAWWRAYRKKRKVGANGET